MEFCKPGTRNSAEIGYENVLMFHCKKLPYRLTRQQDSTIFCFPNPYNTQTAYLKPQPSTKKNKETYENS